jgi:hypothetical protein
MKINKTLTTLICSLLITNVFAQELPVDGTTNKVSYTDIINAGSSSKKALFDKAKKWIVSKNTTLNPYTITYESEDGQVLGKGTFTLPVGRMKYVVPFAIKIAVKDGKCKYELTDLMIQYRTEARASSGGYGYWGSSKSTEAETLEYSLETFYPSHLTSRKPAIKWYEDIRADAFEEIGKQMQSIANSLKQSMASSENW